MFKDLGRRVENILYLGPLFQEPACIIYGSGSRDLEFQKGLG